MLPRLAVGVCGAVFRGHLLGPFCTCRPSVGHWRDQTKAGNAVDARIINTSSGAGLLGSVGQGNYAAAKAGIIGFTRALAHDLADDGITVNCVVPGLIGTPRPKDRPEPAHHLTHQTITGERGRPDDVAAMVRFLCGPGARYINGQAIHANGGAYLGA